MSGVQVKRDGQVRETFDSGDLVKDQNAAFEWLLRHQGMSVDWAIQNEGWEIVVPETGQSADGA